MKLVSTGQFFMQQMLADFQQFNRRIEKPGTVCMLVIFFYTIVNSTFIYVRYIQAVFPICDNII